MDITSRYWAARLDKQMKAAPAYRRQSRWDLTVGNYPGAAANRTKMPRASGGPVCVSELKSTFRPLVRAYHVIE